MEENHGFSEEQLVAIIQAMGKHYDTFTEDKVIEVVNALWEAYIFSQTVNLVLKGEIGVGFENGELSFSGGGVLS